MANSPKSRPVGRPKTAISSQVPSVTKRIRRLIDQVHGGNLAAAGRATGIPYPTIRDLYAGRTVNPGLATLDQLRAPYGVSLNWFTDREAENEVPLQGRTVLLPPHPRSQQAGTRTLRPVLIPYSARTLLALFAALEEWLRRKPAEAERPIVGEAAGEAFTFRLTTFVLQPLLGAEKLGQEVIPSGEPDAAWIGRLEALGAMWRSLLPEVFRGT